MTLELAAPPHPALTALTLTQSSPLYGAGMPLYTPGSICPPALEAIEQWIDTGAAR